MADMDCLAKLNYKIIEEKKGCKIAESVLTSDESGSQTRLCVFPLHSFPFDDSILSSKLDSRYFVQDYFVKKYGDGALLLASGFTDSFESWLDNCNRRMWQDFENEFQSVFRSITRALISLYELGRGHGDLLHGIAIADNHEAKLFGMPADCTDDDGNDISVRRDRKHLRELLTRVLSVGGYTCNVWPKDLNALYDFCLQTFPQAWKLKLQCSEMRWNLDIPYLFRQHEKTRFIRRVSAHIRENNMRYSDFNDYISRYMQRSTWQEEIMSRTDGFSMDLTDILRGKPCEISMGGLLFFTHYIYEHYNECFKYQPQKFQNINDIQSKIDSIFPNFIGAVRYALTEMHSLREDRAEKLRKYLNL